MPKAANAGPNADAGAGAWASKPKAAPPELPGAPGPSPPASLSAGAAGSWVGCAGAGGVVSDFAASDWGHRGSVGGAQLPPQANAASAQQFSLADSDDDLDTADTRTEWGGEEVQPVAAPGAAVPSSTASWDTYAGAEPGPAAPWPRDAPAACSEPPPYTVVSSAARPWVRYPQGVWMCGSESFCEESPGPWEKYRNPNNDALYWYNDTTQEWFYGP
mmetsp:Transcript_102063/g.292876  ORF Transcript_102063/g.292876 Transcript_102063/m.292876 type:complete len:217 (+) Transcript_102063:461-1111(+)